MAIRVALHHRTRYTYDRRVSLSPQVIRLRPALARVRLADVAELSRVEDGKRLRLEELLARTQGDLRALSDVLTRTYLSHAGESRRIERF